MAEIRLPQLALQRTTATKSSGLLRREAYNLKSVSLSFASEETQLVKAMSGRQKGLAGPKCINSAPWACINRAIVDVLPRQFTSRSSHNL